MNNQFLIITKIPINQLSLLILGPTVSTRGSRSHKRRPHASRPTTGRARNNHCRQNIFNPQIFPSDHLKLFAAGTTRSSEKVGGGRSGRPPHRGDSSKNNLENHPVYQTQVKVKVTHDIFLTLKTIMTRSQHTR